MKDYPAEFFDRTVETVEKYLREQTGHGTVIRTPVEGAETAFLCETAADGKRFFLRIRVEQELGFVLCDLYPALDLSGWTEANLLGWCAEQTDRWKIGSLRPDIPRNSVFAHVESAFRDGPVSEDTLACLEQLLLTMLLDALRELEAL